VKASRVSWAASRAVMKNEITTTPGGGWSTNVDINADLPAQAGARHHTYGPRAGSVQNPASSPSSAWRPNSSVGAIRCTCWRYAERTPALAAANWTVTLPRTLPMPIPP
jgi:hypothetical protein